MKADDVPQYEARSLNGVGKALYALNDNGEYALVRSAGWEAEEIVLDQAIDECERQARDAFARAKRGESSPLEYHMYRLRMDVLVLSQSVGMFQWRVKRHLKGGAFAKLSAKTRDRYAHAMGLTLAELDTLPEHP